MKVLANVGSPLDLILAGRQRPGGLELEFVDVCVGLGPGDRPLVAAGIDETKPGDVDICREVDDHRAWQVRKDIAIKRRRCIVSALRVCLSGCEHQPA